MDPLISWYEKKRQHNLQKHGVDFQDAALIFEDRILEREDTRGHYDEKRFRALGMVDDEAYVVVYTWRASVRWIISAWKVGADGKKRYERILS